MKLQMSPSLVARCAAFMIVSLVPCSSFAEKPTNVYEAILSERL